MYLYLLLFIYIIEMLSIVFKGVLEQTKLDPSLVNDITVGNVLGQGGIATNSR